MDMRISTSDNQRIQKVLKALNAVNVSKFIDKIMILLHKHNNDLEEIAEVLTRENVYTHIVTPIELELIIESFELSTEIV